MIPNSIFNVDKKDYEVTPLFLGDSPGLLDSVNKQYPKIWKLYKDMKLLDWDENEFDYSTCMAEFQTATRDEYEIMIMTLAWQWEADSVASHSIAPIVAPFVSSSELWAAWLRISDNETIHALTYSEIVRGSFSNPKEVMDSVLGEVAAFKRLSVVAEVMGETKKVAAMLMDRRMERDDPRARDAIMLFTIALLLLERVQFMSSFAITFTFGQMGRFMPIVKAVQKICNEEFNIHAQLDKEILRIEMATELGRASFERIKPRVLAMIKEVTQNELDWTNNRLFAEGRQLAGSNAKSICDWVIFGANDVYDTLGLVNTDFPIIRKNPLKYLEDWIDINKNQPSPQEEKPGNYLLGGFVNNTEGKVYDVD